MHSLPYIYKKIYAMPGQGLEHESNFLEHALKFRSVLSSISQDADQKKNFSYEVINSVYSNEKFDSSTVLKNVSFTEEGIVQRKYAETILSECERLTSAIIPKDPMASFRNFQLEVESYTEEKFRELGRSALSYDSLPLSHNDAFPLAINKFCSGITPDSLTSLKSLAKYVDYNELLTGMACHHTICALVGLSVYVHISGSLLSPGGFSFFLSNAIETLEKKASFPVFRPLTNVVFSKGFVLSPLLGTAAAAGYCYYSPSALLGVKSLFNIGTYMPGNVVVNYLFTSVKSILGSAGYMMGSAFAEFKKGILAGAGTFDTELFLHIFNNVFLPLKALPPSKK